MHHLLEIWFQWVKDWGYLGIILLMAMESSIFPVPSEIVIPPAAFLAAQGHLSFAGVILAGTFGSYLGAAITYGVARAVGRPVIIRYGKFFLLSGDKLKRGEAWLARYEAGGVFFRAFAPGHSASHFHSRWYRADGVRCLQRNDDYRVGNLVLHFGLSRPQSASGPARSHLESGRDGCLH